VFVFEPAVVALPAEGIFLVLAGPEFVGSSRILILAWSLRHSVHWLSHFLSQALSSSAHFRMHLSCRFTHISSYDRILAVAAEQV